MRGVREAVLAATICGMTVLGCNGNVEAIATNKLAPSEVSARHDFVGFDRNLYPGDDRLVELHKHFAFVGYWLTFPPGATTNGWLGKRQRLRDEGFGFLVLSNGREEAEIKRSKLDPAALGKQDGAMAVATTQAEGFPDQTIIFLDQEEGGRLTSIQSAYFFGWTETVAASAFRPGAYLSGQPAPDGNDAKGKPTTITTAQDVRAQIAARKLHPVELWVVQDACPPAPGCVATPPNLKDSGTDGAIVWQYAQSPRRQSITRSCAKTYGSDGQCYAGVTSDLFLDLDVAASSDPSHGR